MTPRFEGIEWARTVARRFLRECRVGSREALDIEKVAVDRGITVVDTQLNGARAQLLVRNGHATILLSHRLTDPAERRWAIAHELGHFVLKHRGPPFHELCEPRPAGRRLMHYLEGVERDIEAEADTFASTVL